MPVILPRYAFYEEVGGKRTQEKEKDVQKIYKALPKIEFKYFIHEEGKMSRYICGQTLHSKITGDIDESCNKR